MNSIFLAPTYLVEWFFEQSGLLLLLLLDICRAVHIESVVAGSVLRESSSGVHAHLRARSGGRPCYSTFNGARRGSLDSRGATRVAFCALCVCACSCGGVRDVDVAANRTAVVAKETHVRSCSMKSIF